MSSGKKKYSATWMDGTQKGKPRPTCTEIEAFREACMRGALEDIRGLIWAFDFTVEDVAVGYFHALQLAARRGHGEVVFWLIDHFALTREVVPDLARLNLVAQAAESGNKNLTERLVERFGMPSSHAIYHRNILKANVIAGRREAANWAFRYFDMAPEVSRAYGFAILSDLASAGDLATMKWFTDDFGVTREDVKNSWTIDIAHRGGHHDMIDWLQREYGADLQPSIATCSDCASGDRFFARALFDNPPS